MIYEYHSQIYGCPVQVSYNRRGILSGFTVLHANEVEKLNTKLEEFKNFYHEAAFLESAKKYGLKLTKVERTVTFEMFWDTYKQKDCGRTKAEAVWNRLSKADQVEAFDYIPRQHGISRTKQTSVPYATTYLNSKRWIQ